MPTIDTAFFCSRLIREHLLPAGEVCFYRDMVQVRSGRDPLYRGHAWTIYKCADTSAVYSIDPTLNIFAQLTDRSRLAASYGEDAVALMEARFVREDKTAQYRP